MVSQYGEAGRLSDMDWVIINHPASTITIHDVQAEDAVCWQIEQRHRELKPLTGSEKCECRKARSQCKHPGCCYHAWLAWPLGYTPTRLVNPCMPYNTLFLTIIYLPSYVILISRPFHYLKAKVLHHLLFNRYRRFGIIVINSKLLLIG